MELCHGTEKEPVHKRAFYNLGRINVHMQVAYQHRLHHITRSESPCFEQNQGSPVCCSCFWKIHHIWLQSLHMAFHSITPKIQLKRNQMQLVQKVLTSVPHFIICDHGVAEKNSFEKDRLKKTSFYSVC